MLDTSKAQPENYLRITLLSPGSKDFLEFTNYIYKSETHTGCCTLLHICVEIHQYKKYQME